MDKNRAFGTDLWLRWVCSVRSSELEGANSKVGFKLFLSVIIILFLSVAADETEILLISSHSFNRG